MAATLTDSGELTTEYFSFPIEKVESTADGDLMVYGKASDGSVDSDQQIVDPKWMSKAIQDWLTTGANVRVQHNPQRDPAGVGLEASTDQAGATWVKSLVVEPVAKKLVSKGALRAYSVGIARPTITRDQMARGGRITDGTLVELSLVDRPANKSCGIQLVKSADDGSIEFTGKMFGTEDAINKAFKDLGGHEEYEVPKMQDLSLNFTPNDLMKILQNKMVDRHYAELAEMAAKEYDPFRYSTAEKRDFDPGVGGGVDRDRLDDSDFAGPHRSFPIVTQSDVSDALHLVGHADNPDAVRARIHSIARRKGFSVPGEKDDSKKGAAGVTDAQEATEVVKEEQVTAPEAAEKEAEPVVTKDPADNDGAGPADKPTPKGKNVPPWMQGEGKKKKVKKANKGDARNAESDNADDDGDESEDTCKADHAHTEKCVPSGTPASASGAKDAAPMDPIPNPNAGMESPMPPGIASSDCGEGTYRKAEESAMLRFKMLGIDTDLGRLHDLTCPAYSPETVAAYHPYSSFKSLIDEGYWQRVALEAAAGKSIQEAMGIQKAWQSAVALRQADEGVLNDHRLEMHKAFRDANPGPTSYPSPGSISPQKYNRPCITEGHASSSPGHDAPNSSPMVATSPASVGSFNHPPLTAGHQSPSPSFMKADFEYPSETGVPTRINYAVMEKERARVALDYMHDHLSRMFPMACPMLAQDPNAQPGSRPVPVPVTKSDEAPAVIKAPAESEEDLLAKALEAEVAKGRGKQLKKLGKKVMKGKLTFDQARAQMGNYAAMKSDEEPVITKAETAPPAAPEPVIKNELTPEIMKSMMAEVLEPMITKVAAQEDLIAKQQKILDAIADMPDPSTATFSGIALKTAQPAAVKSQVNHAEQAQAMIRRNLEYTYSTHSNPAVREAAGEALSKLRGTEPTF